jgi:hypothetical protein
MSAHNRTRRVNRRRTTRINPASLTLEEIPVPNEVAARLLGGINPHVRAYRLGACSVIVTREFGYWHISIAHPGRYPSWDEIAEARYRLIPDNFTMALLLPPRAEYVNMHPNCFQLVEVARNGEQPHYPASL